MAAGDGRTHYVYEAYDAEGLLLYVGCTGDPVTRYRAHMTGNGDARGWFESFVTRWRVSGPYPKPVALDIEKRKIFDGQPIWNGTSIGNKMDRGLVRDYLAYHGVKFVAGRRASRPDLVPATRRAPRLRVIA